MRRRGVQMRGIGSETRRSHRERRKRRVDDVIDARRRSRPVAETPSRRAAPRTLSRGRYKAEGARTIVCGGRLSPRRGDACGAEGGEHETTVSLRRRNGSECSPRGFFGSFWRRAAGPFARQKSGLRTTVRNEQRRRKLDFFAAAAAEFSRIGRSPHAGRTIRPSRYFCPQTVRSWTLERSGRHNSFFYSESEKEWFCLYFLRMSIQ